MLKLGAPVRFRLLPGGKAGMPFFGSRPACRNKTRWGRVVSDAGLQKWRFAMKKVTLSLLAAAAIGAISIGSVSAMPVSKLAGLSESHVQDVRLVCDRFGRCYNTRRAYRSYPYAQRYYGEPSYGYYSGYGRGYYSGYGGPGYGYYGGPRVGIGVGPVGVGIW